MTKIALTALKAFPYAGKRLKVGQEFMARGVSDARVLIAIKNADFAPAMQAEPEPEPATALDVALPVAAPVEAEVASTAGASPLAVAPLHDFWSHTGPKGGLSVEQQLDELERAPLAEQQPAADQVAEPSAEPAAEAPKPRRRYQRRDMTAEGTEG